MLITSLPHNQPHNTPTRPAVRPLARRLNAPTRNPATTEQHTHPMHLVPAPARDPNDAHSGLTRVLLVDDRLLARSGLRAVLDQQGDIEVVGEAATDAQAVAQAHALRPDVVVIDTAAVAINAAAIIEHLAGGPARVLVLSSAACTQSWATLPTGASGLLLSDADPADLAAAVRMVAAGYLLTPIGLPADSVREVSRQAVGAAAQRQLACLTQRERDVLGFLADGCTNAEIAANLCVSQSTVKSHMQHLMAKLNLRNRVEAVIYAYNTGITHPNPTATI